MDFGILDPWLRYDLLTRSDAELNVLPSEVYTGICKMDTIHPMLLLKGLNELKNKQTKKVNSSNWPLANITV
jgi:hypothetical protein